MGFKQAVNLAKIFLVSAPFLSGCDVAQLVQDVGVTEPTTIIAPATELQISDTETAYVVGYDKCPEQSANIFMGVASMKLIPHGCIKLDKDTQEVRVEWRANEADVIEVWKVNRRGDAVSLIRPNGFQVREPSN